MRPPSLRVRVTLIAAVVVAAALTAAALILITALRGNLQQGAIQEANRKLRAAASSVQRSPSGYVGESSGGDGADGGGDGDVRVSGLPPEVNGPRGPEGPSGTPGTGGTQSPQPPIVAVGRHTEALGSLYASVTEVVGTEAGPVTVQVRVSLAPTRQALALVRDLMLFGVPSLVLLVAALTWHLTGRVLAPVASIRATFADITVKDLHQRVPVPHTQDEIAQLAETMNTTLDHLETTLDRHKRFVADAAHELRSPIATLRTRLELGAREAPALADEALADVARLQDLSADLLILARLDAGEPLPREEVDLGQLAAEAAMRPMPAKVVLDVQPDVVLQGSRRHMQRMITNLLDNAVRHASAQVIVRVTREGLDIIDDGPGIPDKEREAVFDRFTRLDEARARDTGGSGLGLAIARDIAAAHGASLDVADSSAGAHLAFRIDPGPAGVRRSGSLRRLASGTQAAQAQAALPRRRSARRAFPAGLFRRWPLNRGNAVRRSKRHRRRKGKRAHAPARSERKPVGGRRLMMQQQGLVGGRYRLEATLGRGGMGTVWRAYDETLNRDVAVKEVVLPHGFGDAERQMLYERTFREAKASARLSHPNVVTVHDVVEEGGRPWIVMEYVRARSLQDIIDDSGPVDAGTAADIGRQILDALGHAHTAGILHRDVKPGNVLVTGEGRAVLTDFGIARTEGDATLTQTGLVMGSPAYISPERAMGERATAASDLWALGATLYAAAEGKAPFERSDAIATLTATMTEPVPVPRNAMPLKPVIDGLLHKDPALRMGAGEARRLLDEVASVRSRAGGRDTAGGRGGRRRALVAGGIVTAALLVTGALVVPPLLHRPATPGSAGFRLHRDPTGLFSLSVPKDWSRAEYRQDGVFFYSADRTAYIQVGHVAKPGPSELRGWQHFAATAARHYPGYRQIRIEPAGEGLPVPDSTGAKAADWEFTWNDSGRPIHVLDRGFVMNGQGFAILLSAPDGTWPAMFKGLQPVYRSFTATG